MLKPRDFDLFLLKDEEKCKDDAEEEEEDECFKDEEELKEEVGDKLEKSSKRFHIYNFGSYFAAKDQLLSTLLILAINFNEKCEHKKS